MRRDAGEPRRSRIRAGEGGRIETWFVPVILFFMGIAWLISAIFPSLPFWVRAIPLGIAGLLIIVAARYALMPPRRQPPSDEPPPLGSGDEATPPDKPQ